MTVTVHDSETLASAAATRIRHILGNTHSAAPSVCLTGGGTAGDVYRALAASEGTGPPVDWARVEVFWGDERDVPPEHPESNFRLAMSTLLSHVPVTERSIHRMEADGRDPAAAARKYDSLLKRTVFAPGRPESGFDLMLLGLGDDAHIASLFPGSPLLTPAAVTDLAVATPPGGTPAVARITLTPQAILASRRILMIVAGASKADAVHAALDLPDDPARWPVHVLRQAADRVEWLIDSAAARSWRGSPHAK
jgi:6-phosphogluconolactonase